MIFDMKTLVTRVTERGQVSIPASIREYMQMTPGTTLLWNRGQDRYTCVITIVRKRPVANVMIGTLAQANDGLITRNADDFRALFPTLAIVSP